MILFDQVARDGKCVFTFGNGKNGNGNGNGKMENGKPTAIWAILIFSSATRGHFSNVNIFWHLWPLGQKISFLKDGLITEILGFFLEKHHSCEVTLKISKHWVPCNFSGESKCIGGFLVKLVPCMCDMKGDNKRYKSTLSFKNWNWIMIGLSAHQINHFSVCTMLLPFDQQMWCKIRRQIVQKTSMSQQDDMCNRHQLLKFQIFKASWKSPVLLPLTIIFQMYEQFYFCKSEISRLNILNTNCMENMAWVIKHTWYIPRFNNTTIDLREPWGF